MAQVALDNPSPCVVVTRPRKQQDGLLRRLQDLGFSTMAFPTIEIVPWYDQAALRSALQEISNYRWLVFTSVNGVKFFFDILQAWGISKKILSSLKIATIGSVTAAAVKAQGLTTTLCPPSFVAEALADSMLECDGPGLSAGGKVLLPRAAKAREILGERLRQAGAEVNIVPIYRTRASAEPVGGFLKALRAGKIQCLSFTSSSTVSCFFEKMPRDFDRRLLERVHIAAIGPITAETLISNGLKPQIVAPHHTTESLALAISEYFRKRNLCSPKQNAPGA